MRQDLNVILRAVIVGAIAAVPASILLNAFQNASWTFNWIYYGVLLGAGYVGAVVALVLERLESGKKD